MAARKINNAAFEALFEKYEKSVGLATALALLNALQGGPFLFTMGPGGHIEVGPNGAKICRGQAQERT